MRKRLRTIGLIFCLLFLSSTGQVLAQDFAVTGTVVDTDTNISIPGVNVIVKGTSIGTVTDMEGDYSITVPSKESILVFSSVGYATQEVPVAGRPTINVDLEQDISSLEEVVLIGYGSQRRKDVTGSVSSVDGEEFENQPITNPLAALQGRTAGVNVVQSGGPGDAPSVVIRGLSSFNQPDPLYIVDGVRVPNLNSINVNDIASIDVLKDAASAAIYGSAAAGGVVVVTTEKGQGAPEGEPVISFNARYGVTDPKLVELLDKDGYIRLQNLINPALFEGAAQLDTLTSTDWIDVLYDMGTEENYALSVSGSSPKLDYLISGYYNAQEGVFLDNFSNVGGIRVNTDYELTDDIKIGEQISITQRLTAPPAIAPKNAPFRTLPIIPVFNEDGSYGTVPPGYNIAYSGPNLYGQINTVDVQNIRNNLQANVYANIDLPLNLSFRSTFGFTYNVETLDRFQDTYDFGAVVNSINSLQKLTYQYKQFMSNYVLTYDRAFNEHYINIVAGYEQITNETNFLSGNMSSVGLPGFTFLQTSESGLTLNGVYDDNGLIKSLFGRINYNYDGRYYFSASIREDANFTVFGPNNQRGIFPAISTGWNISDEDFFEPLESAVTALKVRASYGELGNSNITPYNFVSAYQLFTTSTGAAQGGQNFAPGAPLQIGNTIVGIPNPDVQWETVKETNIAVEGELFDGEFYFTVEWYKKLTEDMLYSLQLPTSSGFTAPFYTNIGEVENEGFDVLLGHRDTYGDLNYSVNVSAGFNQNEVLSLSGAATDAVFGGYNYYNNGDPGFNIMPNQNLTITRPGLPFGSFYGYEALGIFETDEAAASQVVGGNTARAGDLIFEDLNEDGIINDADRQVIGNPNPKVIYGVDMNLDYHNFDLALLFNGVAGVDVFNGVKAYRQYPFSDGNTTSAVFNASFLGDNGLTDQPRIGVLQDDNFILDPNRNYTSVNSYFVEDGSYLKLKNIQLGYTLSNSFLDTVGLEEARVYIMGSNVFTITSYSGLDPELGSAFSPIGYSAVITQGVDAVTNYPQTSIYSVGLNLTF